MIRLMRSVHRFHDPLECQAEQEGGGHPVAIQTADPAVRSSSVGIDPAGTLHTPVGAGEPQPQETVLRLLFFIPFPVEVNPSLGRPAEQVLTHRVDCFEMNRFHRFINSLIFQIWALPVYYRRTSVFSVSFLKVSASSSRFRVLHREGEGLPRRTPPSLQPFYGAFHRGAFRSLRGRPPPGPLSDRRRRRPAFPCRGIDRT